MQSLWRQPLVHFLVAGALIFAWNTFRNGPEPAVPDRIVVTVAQVERLAGLWQETWGRPPTETELQALVRDHIKEEVYYREAKKLGLDVNDTVIRRRLRQKMEFLTTGSISDAPPDEAILEAYFQERINQYRITPLYDFEQVYFSAGKRDVVRETLALLRSGTLANDVGEQISLPRTMIDASEADVARTFGPTFYTALGLLQTGEWEGPVESGFGLHLVKVERVAPARLPTLHEVRRRVEDDWRADRRTQQEESAFRELRARYTIEIVGLDE